ncbi:SURF1-domain-containing protein [Paxillus ammoniavirescens]|nr:SURF1-domain-containing protein [Paxillus ammoniavirescens]
MFSLFRGGHSKGILLAFRARQRYPHPQLHRFVHTGESPGPGTSNYAAKKVSWINPTILVLGFIPIFTFALGTWQLQRLQWKINLIDELEEKLERDPILLPKRINVTVIPEFAYRRVLLRGRWDHAHAILLGPRVRDGAHGYHVITPLIRTDGSTVWVDRGFIGKAFADNYVRGEEGEVDVEGMLRISHTRNTFTPDNEPAEGKWYWADIDAMTEYAGGEAAGVQPVFIEEIFNGHAGDAASCISKGTPVGRAATVDVRNAHLSYVITWYSLSVFTAGMLGRLIMKRKAQRAVQPMPR